VRDNIQTVHGPHHTFNNAYQLLLTSKTRKTDFEVLKKQCEQTIKHSNPERNPTSTASDVGTLK
jgi:hypothetical protein